MNEQLTSIGPALANHLWQTTAFIAAVWLTTLALKKNQARVRYALWLAASLKFLLPFSLLIALGSMLPRPQQAVAAPAVYATVDEVAQPFSQFDAAPMPAAPVPTLLERVEAHVPITLAAIWLCGLVLLLALWVARWLQVWRTLRRASRAVSGREFDLLRHVERAGCPAGTVSSHGRGRDKRSMPLLLSRELMEPGIFGAFRPVLIWPEQLSAHLDDEHIEAILIHELAHARRRDNLTAALHMLVTALFWFHPLVWWMERRMIEEREHACDEAVVATGSRPGIYAESLLRACRFCIESPLTCVAGITGADLRDRIVQIMTQRISRKLTTANKLLLLSATLFIIAVPIALGQAQAAVRIEAMAVKITPAPIRAAAQMMIAATQAPPAVVPSSVQQTTDDKPSATDPCTIKPGAQFDVVSIRPSKAGPGDWDSESTEDGVNSSGSLRNLIEEAYGLRDFQIAGGPDWMVTQTFDIKAKFDNPDKPGSIAAQKAINRRWAERYQSLLIDRFHFKCHMTTAQLPVYDLVVAKHGTKMKRATAEESNSNSTEIQSNRQGLHALGVGVTMQGLVALFARSAGRAIVDKTGLTGSYDFTLNWAAANRRATQDAHGGVPLPELPEAMEEQLGLKLVASKGPVPVMVVDHVDKPELEGAEVQTVPIPAQSAPTTPANNIAATWQGTLANARGQRFVVKITKAGDGTLRAKFFNIDGDPGGISAISTTLDGSLLKLELPFATYEGTLSADGNSIIGTWRQGQKPLPLNLGRATSETEWTIPQPPPRIAPMAADANPTFAVATIKPSRPEEHGPRYDFSGRRFSVVHISLDQLIQFAYGLQQSQIAKTHEWVNSESYDIAAIPDGEGEPGIKQWESMVKKLLADRFQFKFHFEKQEQTVYVLTVAKTGPKLTKSKNDPNASGGNGFGPPGNFGASNQTMADIAKALGAGVLNRPVVDQTGLAGKFSLRLTWTPDGPETGTDNPNAPPDFFTAIQEQLGLKLASSKAPVDILMIDHIEKPSQN